MAAILGGWSNSDKSGEKTESSKGDFDYWIVKLNSKGNIQWQKTIGGNGSDNFEAMQQTRDSGYIISGYSSSDKSGDKSQNSKGVEDYWVVKLNKMGAVEWDQTYGGTLADYSTCLQQTADNGYIIGGASASNKSGNKSQDSRGYDDYWVIKINSKGRIEWDKTLGGANYEELGNDGLIQQSGDGGYVLQGSSYSNKSGDKTDNHVGPLDVSDYWVVKLDTKGNKLWDKTIGGEFNDYGTSVKEIKPDVFLLGGSSYSNFGDKREKSRGQSDYWIVTLAYSSADKTFTVSAPQVKALTTNADSLRFTVYPNPVSDVLHIKVSDKATVSLLNAAGTCLLTKVIKTSGEMNVRNLPKGLYYLVNNMTGQKQKVIIEK